MEMTTSLLTRQEYALKLLKTPPDAKGESKSISVAASLTSAPGREEATTRLLRILLDAMGNAAVTVEADDGQAGVGTGAGSDTISISASYTAAQSGEGDDVISIKTSGAYFYQDGHLQSSVSLIDAGAGDDLVSINSHGRVERVQGGDGNDKVIINSSMKKGTELFTGISNIYGGNGDDDIQLTSVSDATGQGDEGNDVISVKAGGMGIAGGGTGNDTIIVDADLAGADGGDGDDLITVHAGRGILGVSGGNGNDVLDISGGSSLISGGTGDDQLILNAHGEKVTVQFNEGDGQDLIETNKPVEIRLTGPSRTKSFKDQVILNRNDDGSATINFKGSKDSITVKFTGELAATNDVELEFVNGGVMLRPKFQAA